MHLLIVDDEPQTREGLRTQVDWSAQGITRVSAAAHGLDAAALIARDPADVIVSDVRMPRMDGVELLKRLRGAGDATPFIFLSGYSDKEYLKAAIRFGAVDYIEKPVNLDELYDSVSRALGSGGKLRRPAYAHLLDGLSRSAGYARFVPMLLITPASGADQQRDHMKRYQAAAAGLGYYMRCDVSFDRLCVAFVALPERDAFDPDALYAAVRQAMDEAPVALAVGETLAAADVKQELNRVMIRLTEFMDCPFVNGFALYHAAARPDVHAMVGALIARLEDAMPKGVGLVGTFVTAFAARLRGEPGVSAGSARDAMNRIFCSLNRLLPQGPDTGGPDVLAPADTLTGLAAQVSEKAEAVARACVSARVSRAVSKALTYINRHYTSNITMQLLREVTYLSPTYLSRLFRQETGLTISQYVNLLRLEKARQLLRDRSVRLYEISYQIGIEDASYFSRLFKQHEGLTPSEYREAHA